MTQLNTDIPKSALRDFKKLYPILENNWVVFRNDTVCHM